MYGGLDTITANKDLHYIDFGESLRDFNEVIKTRKHGDMIMTIKNIMTFINVMNFINIITCMNVMTFNKCYDFY